jgi:hypothetical protein
MEIKVMINLIVTVLILLISVFGLGFGFWLADRLDKHTGEDK